MSILDHKKLAVIHIVKRDLNLGDEEYRDMLEQVAGVRSARDLDDKGFQRLMRFFARSQHYQVNADGLTLRQKLFVNHVMDALGWEEGHRRNFLNKYYGKRGVEELSRKEGSKVIIALKSILSTHQHRS